MPSETQTCKIMLKGRRTDTAAVTGQDQVLTHRRDLSATVWRDVSLARIHGNAAAAGAGADLARALVYRPEPALATGGRADERRRLWDRLVRQSRGTGDLPQHRARVERQQPPRARGAHRIRSLLRPYPRGDRLRGSADQLPPIPPRPLAVHAQRLPRRFRAGQARAHDGDRPLAVPPDLWTDRHRDTLLPRAHARPRKRPPAGGRQDDRPDRARRPRPRYPLPFP